MTLSGSRGEAESSLVRALSRSIGYTSAAYDLTRIVSVLEYFQRTPSAYKSEIVSHLKGSTSSEKGLNEASAKYISETPNFTLAMRLIETVSVREAHLQRYAATELGRSLLGAKRIGHKDFYRYFLSKVVLAADADDMVPVLAYTQKGRPGKLPEWFGDFQKDLRERRWNWLQHAFPERILMTRVARQLYWLSAPKSRSGSFEPEVPSSNTARHHATPRLGWLEELGLLNQERDSLSVFGQDVLASLMPTNSFFWLGPSSSVQDELRVPSDQQAAGPYEDTWNFATPLKPPTEREMQSLVTDVADVMVRGFKDASLVHAPQASLRLPIEYIAYRSYCDRVDYKWEDTLHLLFVEKRGMIDRLSARKGQIGFYTVRSN